MSEEKEDCHVDCPLRSERKHYDEKIQFMQTDIDELKSQQAEFRADFKVLQYIVEENARNSTEWHTIHNEQLEVFRSDLKSHMDNDSKQLAAVMTPVINRLDALGIQVKQLYDRWWQSAVGLISLLLLIVGFLLVKVLFP